MAFLKNLFGSLIKKKEDKIEVEEKKPFDISIRVSYISGDGKVKIEFN